MLPIRTVFSLFSKREQALALMMIFLLFIGACLETVGVSLIFPFISLLIDPEVSDKYKFLDTFKTFLGVGSHQAFLIAISIFLLVFYVLKNIFLSFLNFFKNNYIYSNLVALSQRLLDTYLSAPYSFHLSKNSSELIRNVMSQTNSVFVGVVNPLFLLIGDSILLVLILAMLFIISPIPTLAAIVILGSISFFFLSTIRKHVSTYGKSEQESWGEMLKWLNQALGSIKETKVLGAEKFFMDYFSYFCRNFSHARRTLVTISEFPRLVFETIAVSGVIIVVLTMLTLDKAISSIIPMIALFTAAAFRIMPALSRVMTSLTTIRHHMPALEVVHHDLNQILESRPKSEPDPGTAKLDFSHSIVFKHVDFSYDSSNVFALRDISFEILKGQTIAFAGPTGSGKTSIVDLIIGLLEPTGGEILIDDHAISDLNQAWRKNIGYIPQNIFLLDDTIRRNVALGVQEENVDDELIWEALRLANVDEYVLNLPDRLESVIGEHGVRISGGQRQRIGIARALYHDPAVLVLDEATSALDYETESAITESIRELSHHKTVVIIAHRIETLKGCDQIFVVNDGRIQDSGSYAELASRPSYLENILKISTNMK